MDLMKDNMIVYTDMNYEHFADPVNEEQGYTLDQLQLIVGGIIEIIPMGKGRIAVLNEEGKLKDLEFNSLATQMLEKFIPKDDYVVGNVLFCKTEHVR